MSQRKVRNGLEIEWWVIQKKQIYSTVFGIVSIVALLAGAFYVWRYGLPFNVASISQNDKSGARFVSFEGDVRVLRASTRETVRATAETLVFAGDTVQTQADGRARLSLADGSTLVVRENSIVVIRNNSVADDGQRANVKVGVDRGQINVRTEDQTAGTRNVVETPKTQNTVGAQTTTSFGVKEDKTEEIRVSTGQIESVSASSGEKTTIRSGEYVAVNQSGTIARRERMLEVPAPVTPRDLEKIQAGGSGAAAVALEWNHPPSGHAATYRVEVATSPFFVQTGKVFERDQLSSTAVQVSELKSGAYFWRVRATAHSGQISDWSEPQKFTVAPPGSGEKVTVSAIAQTYLGGRLYILSGQAKPGTIIRCEGRETYADRNQTWRLQITAAGGETVIEAQDQLNNRSQYRVELKSKV